MTKPTSPAPRLTSLGVEECRGCHCTGLISVLDLGEQPLANELLATADEPDDFFPLHLRICPNCGLGQVGEFVKPERIFGDYPYLSSVSSTWLAHAQRYAEAYTSGLHLAPDDLVVEVASNDGYLLREFVRRGIPVLGVEPAGNVADLARQAGVRTLTAFFGRETARAIVAEHGHPRLVAANNVMAHVPDLDDFVGGFAELADERTVITVENPSFVTLLLETQFDTIYHEHFSYLSAHSVARAVDRQGLELVDVEELPTHGGSYRYTIVRKGARPADPRVAVAIASELERGLLSPDTWRAFADHSRATIAGLRSWLDERAARSEIVVAYGAAAKGNTLLNAAGVHATDILVVADGSPEKQGKLLPGSRIAVVSPDSLAHTPAAAVLILPWNIAGEIAPLVHRLKPDAGVWTAVPTMRTIAT